MHCVMKISLSALSVLVLACASANARAADSALGWLVYEKPSVDNHLVPAPGQARPIMGAWLRSGSANIVDVLDQGGTNVPVHFFRNSSAAEFLAAVESGASYDITDCAHADAAPAYTERGAGGCTLTSTLAEFHCDLLDHVHAVDTASVDPAHYNTPKDVVVYLLDQKCNPSK